MVGRAGDDRRHSMTCAQVRRVPRDGSPRATYHRWRSQSGGLNAEDAKRLKDLERENAEYGGIEYGGLPAKNRDYCIRCRIESPLKWRLQEKPAPYRWRPVWERLIGC